MKPMSIILLFPYHDTFSYFSFGSGAILVVFIACYLITVQSVILNSQVKILERWIQRGDEQYQQSSDNNKRVIVTSEW